MSIDHESPASRRSGTGPGSDADRQRTSLPGPGPDTEVIAGETPGQGEDPSDPTSPSGYIRLMLDYRDGLKRQVRARLKRRPPGEIVDASDIVQDTFLIAFRRMHAYLGNDQLRRRLPFRNWLYRLADCATIDRYRRAIARGRDRVRIVSLFERSGTDSPFGDKASPVGLVAGTSSPSVRLCREERRGRLIAAMDRLARHQREVLRMRFLDGLTTREIAQIMGRSETAIRMLQLRALQALRQQDSEHLADTL